MQHFKALQWDMFGIETRKWVRLPITMMPNKQNAESAISILNDLRQKGILTYQIDEVGGSSNHGPFTFNCTITFHRETFQGRGKACNKRGARQLAAKAAIDKVAKDRLDKMFEPLGFTTKLFRSGQGYVCHIMHKGVVCRVYRAPTVTEVVEEVEQELLLATICATLHGLMEYHLL